MSLFALFIFISSPYYFSALLTLLVLVSHGTFIMPHLFVCFVTVLWNSRIAQNSIICAIRSLACICILCVLESHCMGSFRTGSTLVMLFSLFSVL